VDTITEQERAANSCRLGKGIQTRIHLRILRLS